MQRIQGMQSSVMNSNAHVCVLFDLVESRTSTCVLFAINLLSRGTEILTATVPSCIPVILFF